MKKFDITFLITGIILSFFPQYYFWGWIYVDKTYPKLQHLEKVAAFREDILFNLFEGRFTSFFTFFTLGFIAGVLLLLSLINSLNYGMKMKTLKLFFFILNLIFSFFLLWGVM